MIRAMLLKLLDRDVNNMPYSLQRKGLVFYTLCVLAYSMTRVAS